MFKNAFLYRVTNRDQGLDANACLQSMEFVPCGPTQEKSVGWVPPREANGLLVEVVGGQCIMKLMTETKAVPAAVVKRSVDRLCDGIERHLGRKPGKKERRELKDEALLDLLPKAFPKQSATMLWYSPSTGLLVIDASTQSKADDAVSALIKSIDGLALKLINPVQAPASAMAHWLTNMEGPDGFTIDRECELKACDESKAVVKYGRHALDIEEVAQHIRTGKMPTKLALTWNDRLSFVLTEGLQIKKIELLDATLDQLDRADDEAHTFDTDVTIFTGEMSKFIPDLLAVMGGEAV